MFASVGGAFWLLPTARDMSDQGRTGVMKRVRATAAALALVASIAAAAQPEPRFDLIDAYVEAELNADHVPGGALVITRGSRIVHLRGFGEDGSGHQVTPATGFLLGSMSKSFTALAVMQLVDQKRITLDSPVRKYLPWFKVGEAGASDTITVGHLLAHTSGIPTLAPQAAGENPTLRQHVEALADASLGAPPGVRHEYSSPNYLVLGAIIEAVSGQSFAEYMHKEVLMPLGMRQSFTSQKEAMRSGMARGHRYWFGMPIATVLPPESGRLPTAAMISSANDLGRFLVMQQGQGAFEGRQLLSPQAWAAMHEGTTQGQGFNYAMGWRVSKLDGVLAIHHGGILPHFRGKMVMLPEEGWGVAVLTNVSSALPVEATSHRIADQVALALVGRPLAQPHGELPRTYLIVAGFMALITIAEMRKLWKLRGWRERAAGAPKKAWVGAIMDLLVPIVLLVGIPAAQGLSLSALMRSAPDITWWLIILATVEVAVAFWKATSLHLQLATRRAG